MKNLSKNDLSISDYVAEIEISYSSHIKPVDRLKVTTATDAFAILYANWNLSTIEYIEEFKILLLNRANQVLGIKHISKGGTDQVTVDKKVIFQAALKANASSIIAVHNHPSSSLKPSQADINLTRTLKSAGDIVGIQVIDHLIVTIDGFYSFADNGEL